MAAGSPQSMTIIEPRIVVMQLLSQSSHAWPAFYEEIISVVVVSQTLQLFSQSGSY